MSHRLDETRRPAACTCGGFSAAGSPTFVFRRFIVHLQDALARAEWPDGDDPPEWMVNFPPLDEIDHDGVGRP